MVKVGMCLFVCTSRFAERDLLRNAHPMKDLTFFVCLFVWLFIAFGLISPPAFICRKRKGKKINEHQVAYGDRIVTLMEIWKYGN